MYVFLACVWLAAIIASVINGLVWASEEVKRDRR